jgi:hypothetical protein
LAGILLNPSLPKRGRGDFVENRFIQEIPLYPPFPKGDDIKKDSGQARMTNLKNLNNFQDLDGLIT